jgi:hypothetical protein
MPTGTHQTPAPDQEEVARPFDPGTDVSADARFIVRQLTWNLVLWFLVVPLILGFLLWAVSR